MQFECPVVQVEEVIAIEGADRIEAVRVGGYRSIVAKGAFKPGDQAIYIPCGLVVPLGLQEKMGLVGKLSGGSKDRVKEIKLKGVLSEGLVLPLDEALPVLRKYVQDNGSPENPTRYEFDEHGLATHTISLADGSKNAEMLGITKYEPPIPGNMQGRVKPYPFTLGYDIENIKKSPRSLKEGETVAMSEKVHGTLIQVGLLTDGTAFVTSKGLGRAGIIIADVPENENNLYIQTAKRYGLIEKLREMQDGKDLYLFGEVYGLSGASRIQDLAYTAECLGAPQFAAFDIFEGKKNEGQFLDHSDLVTTCAAMDIPTVNYLYVGPFSQEVLAEHTNGKETMSGSGVHIREGVVVKPLIERWEHRVGRVCFKSVSEAYLTRKGEVTEYA